MGIYCVLDCHWWIVVVVSDGFFADEVAVEEEIGSGATGDEKDDGRDDDWGEEFFLGPLLLCFDWSVGEGFDWFWFVIHWVGEVSSVLGCWLRCGCRAWLVIHDNSSIAHERNRVL